MATHPKRRNRKDPIKEYEMDPEHIQAVFDRFIPNREHQASTMRFLQFLVGNQPGKDQPDLEFVFNIPGEAPRAVLEVTGIGGRVTLTIEPSHGHGSALSSGVFH